MQLESSSKNGAESETISNQPHSHRAESFKNVAGEEINVILQNLTQAVIRYDCQMNVLWANKAGYNFLKEHPDPSKISGCEAFWSNTDRLYPARPVTRTIKTGNSHNAVITLSKGSVWRLESYPVFDSEDRLEGAIEMAVPLNAPVNSPEEKTSQFWESLSLLTERERQVMNLVAEGKINRAIANELQLSPKTVEIHRARMMKKLKVDSVAHLVRYLTRLDLI